MVVQETATGFISAMKSQPISLALSVVCLALIALMYYQNHEFNQQREANVKVYIDMQRETHQLLSRCVIPLPPTPGT